MTIYCERDVEEMRRVVTDEFCPCLLWYPRTLEEYQANELASRARREINDLLIVNLESLYDIVLAQHGLSRPAWMTRKEHK